jgi:oxalate---CoA ligase
MSFHAPTLPEIIHTLPDAIAWWAARTPDALALEATGWEPASYRVLWQTICRLRRELQAAGIGRGNRLALLVPDGLPLAVAALAAAATAVVAPIDPGLRALHRDRVLANLGVDALLTSLAGIGDERFGSPTPWMLMLHGSEERSVAALRVTGQPAGVAADRSPPQPADTAYIFHTSGTTGEPRPVAHRHDTYLAWARASVHTFGIGAGDRTLGLGSLAQAAGEVPLRHALVAGSVFVASDRSSPASLLDRLDAAAPTWLYLPAGIVHLIDRELVREPGRHLPPSLRFVRFTSAGIPHERIVAMEERFGVPIYPEYSSNEAGIIARVTPPPDPRKPGSVGRPFLDVAIVDEAGAGLPAGKGGEIAVRGPTVTGGGSGASDCGRERFLPGGWLRTGDLGLLDDEGFLFVTGRVAEIINRGGVKIVPEEVDAALSAHPAVAESAAFGVADDLLGEDIVAAVVLESAATVTARELRAWLLDRLSAPKVPRRIWFVDELPRTATGKVERGTLARLWLEAFQKTNRR